VTPARRAFLVDVVAKAAAERGCLWTGPDGMALLQAADAIRELAAALDAAHAQGRRDERVESGDALRLARERSGHTMGDLARFLGVDVVLVSAIERGNAGVLRAYLEAHAHVPAAVDAGRADRGEG